MGKLCGKLRPDPYLSLLDSQKLLTQQIFL